MSQKLPNGLHPRAYVAAKNYLSPLSDLIRNMDGPEHVRQLSGKQVRLNFGNKLIITYSIRGCTYILTRTDTLKEWCFDTKIEVLMVLPYLLYTDYIPTKYLT